MLMDLYNDSIKFQKAMEVIKTIEKILEESKSVQEFNDACESLNLIPGKSMQAVELLAGCVNGQDTESEAYLDFYKYVFELDTESNGWVSLLPPDYIGAVDKVLNECSAETATIIRMRFGLDDGEESMSMTKIADKLGVKASHVSQVLSTSKRRILYNKKNRDMLRLGPTICKLMEDNKQREIVAEQEASEEARQKIRMILERRKSNPQDSDEIILRELCINELKTVKVADMGFSSRVDNALSRHSAVNNALSKHNALHAETSVNNLYDLCLRTDKQLKGIRNLGNSSFEEIISKRNSLVEKITGMGICELQQLIR